MNLKKVRTWGPLCLFVTILALEGYFRWHAPVVPPGGVGNTYSNRFKYVNNFFGYATLDPATPNFFFYIGQKKFVYRHNSAGARSDTEIGEKEPGEIRILLLGGSFVHDIYNSQEETWPVKLELALRRSGLKAKVLNMGMPGSGAQHAMLKAIYSIGSLKPDVVVFSGGWNDFRYFHVGEPLTELPFQGDSLANLKAIVMKKSVDLWFSVVGYSALFTKLSRYPAGVILTKAARAGMVPVRTRNGVIAVPVDSPNPVALEQFRSTVRVFQDQVAVMGAVPVLLHEPNYFFSEKGEPNVPVGDYKATLSRAGIRASLKEVRSLINGLKGGGKPVFDFTDQFSGRNDLLSDHIHLSQAGGDVLVKLMVDNLKPVISKVTERRRHRTPAFVD